MPLQVEISKITENERCWKGGLRLGLIRHTCRAFFAGDVQSWRVRARQRTCEIRPA